MRRTNQWPTIAMLTTDNALWPRPRVNVMATASAATLVTWLMAHTTMPRLTRDRGEHDAGAEPIDQTADAQRAGGADDRGPEVQRGVGDAIEAEIGEQRFGDQTESLRAARQRADHRERRGSEDVPAVEETAATRRSRHLISCRARRSDGRSRSP